MKGQKFAGRSELKLHNNKQDGSNVRQALAYRLFTAAGLPAPRCNLAHLTVNGTNLGVYSHLEPIDDAFLKRQFGSDQGNLYEAQISDFRPGWTRTFEKKNNKPAGREDLDAWSRPCRATIPNCSTAWAACTSCASSRGVRVPRSGRTISSRRSSRRPRSGR